MSKVPYTFMMDEYFCNTLDYLRKMYETRDFSGMMAVIERLQIHGNSMESGLWEKGHRLDKIDSWSKDEELSDSEFREKVIEQFRSFKNKSV